MVWVCVIVWGGWCKLTIKSLNGVTIHTQVQEASTMSKDKSRGPKRNLTGVNFRPIPLILYLLQEPLSQS